MTSNFYPQHLQAKLGLDLRNDHGPESDHFAPVSDRARNALSELLEHSAQRLVQRAQTPSPSDKHLVRDTKVFVDCVVKLERMNRGGGASSKDELARVTQRTRKFVSELLEHVLVAVVLRAQDPTDDHIIRDTKIMLDCVVKVERLNRAEGRSVAGDRWPEGKQPAGVSRGRTVSEMAKDIVADDKSFTERLPRQEGQQAAQPAAKETVVEKEKQTVPKRSTGVSPVFERALCGQDARPYQERLDEHLCPPIPVALGKRNRHGQIAPVMKSQKSM